MPAPFPFPSSIALGVAVALVAILLLGPLLDALLDIGACALAGRAACPLSIHWAIRP